MELEKRPKFDAEALEAFKESFEKEKETEEKVAKALEFMKVLLSDINRRSLRDFWGVKKLVGPLFKEKMNPIKRKHLWSQYAELGDEARRLKEIKDEQTAFSVEQIELAVEALEADARQFGSLLEQINPRLLPEDFKNLPSLNGEKYQTIQKELQLLKTLISRLDALRKEILSIDMRISHKNKILRRLSKLGDKVFPKRKEQIKEVSESFIADVEAFVKDRFPEGSRALSMPYYVIRDEIKSFQRLAKFLTLNNQCTIKARKMLSECWDKVKEKEIEWRLEMEERSEEQKKNFDTLLPKIEALEAFCKKGENQEKKKILEESKALQSELKQVSLNREQVKTLKNRIQAICDAALDELKAKVEEKKHAAEKEVSSLKEKLDNLLKNQGSASLEHLEKKALELRGVYEALKLSTLEIHSFEREFADLKSFIFDKKEKVIGAESLEDLYDERSRHLEVIKAQMEECRKKMGGSNLDFEKAMVYRELYDSAKIHLKSELKALENLEEKLI